jgi:ATP-dependent DNA ligase
LSDEAIASAFDLLRLDGDDMRRLPLSGEAAEAAAAVRPRFINPVQVIVRSLRQELLI